MLQDVHFINVICSNTLFSVHFPLSILSLAITLLHPQAAIKIYLSN